MCGAPWPGSRSRSSDVPAPRTAGQRKKTVGEVFSQDRVQQRLVMQMTEVRKGPVEQFFEFLEAEGRTVGGCPKDYRRTRCVF